MNIFRFLTPALLAVAPLHAQVHAPSPSPSPTPANAPTATAAPKPSPGATPPPPTAREAISNLSDLQVDQTIQKVRADFLDPSQTDDAHLHRATLEGLIARLGPGLELTTEAGMKAAANEGPGFVSEILDGRIGYLRLGELGKDALAQMDSALAKFKEKSLHAVVLDLRDVPASTDYEMAAEFARRFCPKGKLMFSVEKPGTKQERLLTSNQDPAFTGILIVLTDRNNSGGAEALAEALRQNTKAMVIGATTRGQAVEFSDAPLGDGQVLRIAVSQVVIPGSGAIYPDGVKPDISIALNPIVQAKIFALSKEKGVSRFVFETERPHFNEAALAANTNPEIDPSVMKPDDHSVLWDAVLQRAVDLVTTIDFYKKAGQP